MFFSTFLGDNDSFFAVQVLKSKYFKFYLSQAPNNGSCHTSHSAYVATATESNGAKIDDF